MDCQNGIGHQKKKVYGHTAANSTTWCVLAWCVKKQNHKKNSLLRLLGSFYQKVPSIKWNSTKYKENEIEHGELQIYSYAGHKPIYPIV